MNNCCIYLNFASHVDLIILIIVNVNLLLFLMMYYIYTLNQSFLSKIILKYHILLIDIIIILLISIIIFIFHFLYFIKYINIYLNSLNFASYYFHHFFMSFNLPYIFSAFPVFVNFCIPKMMSSMNPSSSSPDCDIFSKSLL